MREIKFRAWDNEDKIMIESFSHMGKVGHCYVYNFNPTHTFEVQQFTGLQDKNGKDIYCGDILKYKVRSYDFNRKELSKEVIGVVEWDEMKAGFYITISHMYPRQQDSYFRGEFINSKNKEVLGNIFENPELIN